MKLYVGNLSYGTTKDSLEKYFSQVGQVVSTNIITDKYSGKSKGFGFVEMSSEEEGNAAISKFHDQEFDGRKLTVSVARPPKTDGRNE